MYECCHIDGTFKVDGEKNMNYQHHITYDISQIVIVSSSCRVKKDPQGSISVDVQSPIDMTTLVHRSVKYVELLTYLFS